MKLSLNWLKDYVALDAPVEELCRAITFLGFEVEQVIRTGAPPLSSVVVGEVRARERHPNADKLSVCQVDVGAAGGVKTIVCGAQNYQVGDRVPVALPGAVLPGNFVIRQSKIRGQLSDGMMCSAKELGVSEEAAGLLILDGRPAPGTPINEVLPPGDVVFDVEITPNRPDCLCHLGVARELAAWFRKVLAYPQPQPERRGEAGPARPDLLAGVRVDVPEDCPLYTARVLTGVKIGPSPAWLQERLRAVGLRPVNNVVDAGNYVMLETGQPLHAFDARRLQGGTIVVRRAADGERIVTLDGRERALDRDTLVIADAARPVVIAGIMGGQDSGVGADTTDLVLECAVFRRQSVRQTSRRLGLTSDSAYRYERGVDPHGAAEAAARAVDLILATAGGSVAGPAVQAGGDVPWQREIVVSPGYVAERLGFELPAEEMKAALEALELRVVREDSAAPHGAVWTVAVPSWRDDLDRPIDLVEEILRVYGTEKIPPATVLAPGLPEDDAPVVRFNRSATDYLVGHDFHECVTYTLRSAREVTAWLPAAAGEATARLSAETASEATALVPAATASEATARSAAGAGGLALANPFVEDQSHLRPTLLGGLIEALKLNQARGVRASRLCETGRIFLVRDGQTFEYAAAAFLMTDPADDRSWRAAPAPDFYDAKRHVAALAAVAGADLAGQPPGSLDGGSAGWQSGHAAAAGATAEGWLAQFGLLDLAMLKALGIEGKVYAGLFAILPEKLAAEAPRRRYADFSLFPSALRDLALVVEAGTPAESVRRSLATAAREASGAAFRLEELKVFDVYQGEGLPAGTKSLAFSLVFRADDRTLTDEEVNAAFGRIQEAILRTTSWQIRR